MAIKKKKNKKNFFIYNIKTPDDKRRKVWVKALFQEKEKNCFLPDVTDYTYLIKRNLFQVYDYSNLNSEYFADLYCYLRKYF